MEKRNIHLRLNVKRENVTLVFPLKEKAEKYLSMFFRFPTE